MHFDGAKVIPKWEVDTSNLHRTFWVACEESQITTMSSAYSRKQFDVAGFEVLQSALHDIVHGEIEQEGGCEATPSHTTDDTKGDESLPHTRTRREV